MVSQTVVYKGVMDEHQIVLTDEEAAELYRFTRNAYINPNTHPALMRLIARVSQHVDALART